MDGVLPAPPRPAELHLKPESTQGHAAVFDECTSSPPATLPARQQNAPLH